MKKIVILFAGVLLMATIAKARGPYKPGDIADDFSLKSVDGSMVSLADRSDAMGFIVVFSSNTCPTAIKYEERIKDLHKTFSAKGFPVVVINSNDKTVSPGDSYAEMQKIAKAKGYSFDYLTDDSQEVARKFGATNTPQAFVLLKEDGMLKVEYTGAIDNNVDNPLNADKRYVEDAVNALLNGTEPPVTDTKAIGCSIKWKKM